MLGNFDQTWSLNFTPRRSTLQKKRTPVCDVKSVHMRTLRHKIERSLGLPFSDSMDPEHEPVQVRNSAISGGCAAHNPVENWRIPHTLTTLSWVDGSVSRGYITIREDYLGEKARAQLNQDRLQKSFSIFGDVGCWYQFVCHIVWPLFVRCGRHSKLWTSHQELEAWLYIAPLHSRTHIWSQDTFMDYLSFLEKEIRCRRRMLKLDRPAAALVICDCASQHSLKKYAAMKRAWCENNNVVPWLLESHFYSIVVVWCCLVSFNCVAFKVWM